jgi:mannosyl-3-phosphoglycerate synthase
MRYTERFGSVRLHDVQKVLELDSGRQVDLPEDRGIIKVDEEAIRDIENKMAIVIPVKDERLKLFEGVVSGIPHDCLTIAVSNSQRAPIDRFRMESDALGQFCHFTRSQALSAHQKDPSLAQALAEVGYTDMLTEGGQVRDGKSEGMVIGMLLAMAANKEYVGFVDADNYFPGAIWEYVKCYAAGFSMAASPYVIVRILWRYKPKISAGMYFKRWGRVSEITNKCLNSVISAKTGFETDIIKTGNAGEHAMTIKLAELLPYASSFAVEPQELISIFEYFGGILPGPYNELAEYGIGIFQIEARNPHLHEEKGNQHLQEMLLSGLGTIYHSALCDEETKEAILRELVLHKALKAGEEPAKVHINAAPRKINLESLMKFMREHLDSYRVPRK